MMKEAAYDIDAEAAVRAMRAAHPDNGDADTEDLERWLAADPRRRGAYLRAHAIIAAGADPDIYAPSSTKVERKIKRFSNARWRMRFVASALAACFILAISMVSVWHSGNHYTTDTGEIRRIPLADGSTAIINTESQMRLKIDEEKRAVILDKGEAWFQVSHDRKRPFVVHSGAIRVRAIGTAFSVRRLDGSSYVVVNEGVVEVWAEGMDEKPQRIAAGAAIEMKETSPNLAPPTPTNVSVDLMWREGSVDLGGKSLAYAVAEFNRYNVRKLVIADPQMQDEKLHGIFSVSDPVQFALAVRDGLGIPVELAGNSDIILGRSAVPMP